MARASYDELKEFQGKRYTGMKVGRGHKWRYDPGEWSEKKVTPDKWTFSYSVKKHRKGKAPEGSGAPVGTAHHWYILADQIVTKLDANTYTTEMAGVKFKVAHKRAERDSWSASERAQRRRVVAILREMIEELEAVEEGSEPKQPDRTRLVLESSKSRHAPRPRPGPLLRVRPGRRASRRRTRSPAATRR